MKIALYPGVFDPVTYGHIKIVSILSEKYDKVIVAVGNNESKTNYMLSQNQRIEEFKKYIGCKNVELKKMDGLLVDFANKNSVDVIIRGVRNDDELKLQNDFKERYKNEYNGSHKFEFIFAEGRYKKISSTLVKEYMFLNKDISKLTPWEGNK